MMLLHLSKTDGIGGTIKSMPEDFIVEEISSDGTVLELDKKSTKPDSEGEFVHFILQKKDWATSSAIHEIGKRLGVGKKRFSYAGTKDKTAISTQLVSAYDIPKERILSLKIKDIQINGAWVADDKVRLGQHIGNRFTIRVEGALENAQDTVGRIRQELSEQFPNYFGEQRFGTTRRNTHHIGQKLLQGRMEDALKLFLCDTEGEKNREASEARKALAETGNYSQASMDYPKHLRLERTVIAHLDRYPGNYANALRKLPRTILLLFVHAFQSDLFNRLLSDRIAEGELVLEEGEYFCSGDFGFPDISKAEAEGWICGKIIGYESPLNGREKNLLEELGMEKESFRMRSMPEIASKGTYRTLMAPLIDFKFNADTFSFALPKGAYATVAMREFIDKKSS
jgi:tRNA pseudouridine13 synthase